MTPQDFCYWLKGFLEIENPTEIRYNQVQTIQDHLNLVFNKITVNRANTATYCQGKFYISKDEEDFQKLFTAHSGITAKGLC